MDLKQLKKFQEQFANIVKKVYREIKYHQRPKDDLEKNYPEIMKEELIDIYLKIC